MNGCGEYEALVAEYAGLTAQERERVDRHLLRCGACSTLLAALEEVDRELSGALAQVEPAPGFALRVLARRATGHPGRWEWLPEILNAIGWSSLVALLVVLGHDVSPAWLELPRLLYAALPLAAAALVVGIRSALGTHS